MIHSLLLALLLSANPAGAQSAGCYYSSGGLRLELPRPSSTGPQFTGCLQRSMEILSSSTTYTGSTTTAFGFGTLATYKITGMPLSDGIQLSSYVYVVSGASVTLQGAAGYLKTSSSVTASGFFGDGSSLTFLTGPSLPVKSKAELIALTPPDTGKLYYCPDCEKRVVVSTNVCAACYEGLGGAWLP